MRLKSLIALQQNGQERDDRKLLDGAKMQSTTLLSQYAFLRTPNPDMLNLMLTKAQMDGIRSYILGLRAAALEWHARSLATNITR